MSVNSSIMRGRLILERRVMGESEMGFGGPEESWEKAAELRCAFEPLVGREFFRANDLAQKQAQIDARIRIRARKGINPADHRIIYGGVVHDIVAVIHDRERGQTQLMVKATAVHQPDGSSVNV